MLRTIRHVSIGQALRTGRAHLAQRWPEHVRHIAIPMLAYSTDTPEAQFLQATLRSLSTEAHAIASLLRRRLQDVQEIQEEVEEAYRALPGFTRSEGSRPSSVSVDDATALARRLEAMASSSKPASQVKSQSEATLIRTNKLMMSAEYWPVTMAWEGYRSRVTLSSRQSSLVTALDEHSIANTASIYEKWVTLRIYTALVERGFRPPEGERNLLDILSVSDGEVALLDGNRAPLRLVKHCRDSRLELVLRHEARLKGKGPPEYREPDLKIEASAMRRSTTAIRETWVFDAKYNSG